MAKIEVTFERIHGAGIEFSSIKINDKLREFKNGKAAVMLEPGQPFEVYWRMQGNPGSTLTIKYTAAGVEKTAVEDAIAEGSTRRTAFKFITL